MPSRAHPWLTAPAPMAALPRDQLEDRIEQLLASQNMAVLATVDRRGDPVASPVEYYHAGLTVYFVADTGSPKLANLRRHPRVSLAIFAPNVGWASVRGCQLFGEARVLEPGTPEHAAGMEIYRWQSSAADLGRPIVAPPATPLVEVTPHRIVYTELWLRKHGYAAKQVWRLQP
ncbi:MAG: pyridoxamine 5'-phosphate oxidase family protein [Chloroflexota bacterium]|nr:pyridoxamine 5'-phosphate oxidase family protein [Dehalococcoidia bacterium]MDW8254987.1 pyridoxamine 5'-phosphate oxidase family protein [Chloroflexota bacterium]